MSLVRKVAVIVTGSIDMEAAKKHMPFLVERDWYVKRLIT